MIDYDVLEDFGTHPLRLEAVFTAEPNKLSAAGKRLYEKEYSEENLTEEELAEKLHAARKRWETRISDRISQGRELTMRHYRMFMAADLAYDNSPLTPEKFAHMLYANGDLQMDFTELYAEVKQASGEQIAEEMFIRDKKNPHNIIGLNTPKLTDFTINLVRPYVRRAVAAQVNRYENMFPFLKYESRSQGLVGRLRADILSEKAEIMTDQFGYRHNIGQEIRGMFLHSHSPTFVENSWAVHRQIHRRKDESRPSGYRGKEVIEKEGVKFKKVHPTRVFYDAHHPLSSLNSDTGCRYAGYWDIVQYRDIALNSKFFNTDSIPLSSTLHNFKTKYSAYFNAYYASTIKNIFDRPSGAESNSRDSNAHQYYSDTIEDDCLWLAHYYEKVTPKNEGLGGYPHPVWIHFIVAGDNTVVFAEVLPSRPGYCLHYDENDDRLFNVSMALDILPYQDQVSNLFSQVLYLLQVQNMLMMAVDADVVPKNVRDEIKKVVEGRKLFDKVHLIEFEQKIEELFEKPLSQKKPIQLFQADVKNIINDLMGAITQTIRLLERNQMMSPNEMGQFVERETSATEVQQVSSTSGDLHSFKSSGIDEARQAMKIIIYESLIACGSKKVKVSVAERYPNEAIRALGFQPDPSGSGMYVAAENVQNLIGTTDALVGEYIFNSRDGAERTSNTEAAKVLMELMRYILSTEQTFKAFVEAYGMEQITKSLSEIFRLAGSPMTLKLPVEFSEAGLKNSLGEDPAEVRRKLMQAVQELQGRVDQLEQVGEDYVMQQEAQMGGVQPPQGQPMPQQTAPPPALAGVPGQPIPPGLT